MGPNQAAQVEGSIPSPATVVQACPNCRNSLPAGPNNWLCRGGIPQVVPSAFMAQPAKFQQASPGKLLMQAPAIDGFLLTATTYETRFPSMNSRGWCRLWEHAPEEGAAPEPVNQGEAAHNNEGKFNGG